MISRLGTYLASIRERASWPVLTQEMRIRQRGAKPFMLIFVYAFVLAAAALFVLQVVAPSQFVSSMSYQGYSSSGYQQGLERMGRTLFLVLLCAQLAMIALIVPAYSAGAITSERERGTIDLLVLTRLKSSEIVSQKLAAAMAQAVMLTVVSLPVVAVVFLLGGLSPLEIAGGYAVLVLTAAMFSALGLLCSSQFASTKTSMFVAYLSVLMFLLGVPLFGALLSEIANASRQPDTFSIAVTAGYAFVGSVFAVFFYAIAASIARNRWDAWRVRLTRMGVFGGIYAVVLAVLANPGCSQAMVNTLYSQSRGIFLPLYVNPFLAIYSLVGLDHSFSVGYWPMAATLIFAALAAYLFKHLSTYRFEAMRRRAS